MPYDALAQVLVLLAAAVLVVATVRRLRLPPILGYFVVGMLLGPHALDVVANVELTRLLAEFGVVFLLFTLGLEFSLPRMIAMKWAVFGLGGAQVACTTFVGAAAAMWLGVAPETAIILGGALAMSSTAIVGKALSERLELGQPHGRLAIGILLFQDLAFVPFLIFVPLVAAASEPLVAREVVLALVRGVLALVVVLLAGRWLLRPLFHEIARTGVGEVFTLAVLLVVLGAAWATHAVGLSLALGAFLAGMMLAETEYRHQIEAVIRPFRDILLGLFFITVGMLLEVSRLLEQAGAVALVLLLLVFGKLLVITVLARFVCDSWDRAMRTGVVLAQGGEFGIALLTLALQGQLFGPEVAQPVLAALVVSMVLSPLLISHNAELAGLVFPRGDTELDELAQDDAATQAVAHREHVIICGYGRVGQNLARVLEKEGFEYIALDLDPFRVRAARQGGDPVHYGDASHRGVLEGVGLAHASVVVITMPDTAAATRITEVVRRLRPHVPVLARTRDDTDLDSLQRAGVTEIVPETLEASLMLLSHVLLLLHVPASRVLRQVGKIRNHRYSMLRNIFPKEDARVLDSSHAFREQLRTLTLPPGARAVGRALKELDLEGAEIAVTAIRRDGIVGRQPVPETVLRENDVVVMYGTPEALEHGESIFLSG